MVLFKRKPVPDESKPPVLDTTEVWSIEDTDEVFSQYDDYLQRMDFYRQKLFTCEITGHSNLTFKEALRSEKEASGQVDDTFPEPLRDPILRKVQFMQISRLDNLVDFIYEEFRCDFYPGEHVVVLLDVKTKSKEPGADTERYTGSIRAKTRFPQLQRTDGTIERDAFCRYFIQLDQRPEDEVVADEKHIAREKKVFTKQRLRSFIKNATNKEAWSGAPWIVKQQLAEKYNLPMEIPPHLTREAQEKVRKANAVHGKKGEFEGPILQFSPAYGPQQPSFPTLKPKSTKNMTQEEIDLEQWKNFQSSKVGNPLFSKPGSEHQQGTNGPPPPGFPMPNGFHPIAAKGQPKPVAPPPPPKYPIEDLEIAPSHDGTHRPPFKFISERTTSADRTSEGAGSGIDMESVGLLLETWDTLNVYCEVFQLDSFTFDDYIDALKFRSEDVQCELLVEIHCAVLKKIVNDANDKNGQIQVTLPYQPESEEESSSNENSTLQSPETEPEVAKPPARSTRSSLVRSEAEGLREATNGLLPGDVRVHRAVEMDHYTRGYDWKQRLRKRDFQDGHWVVILVGLLNQLSGNSRMAKQCNEILQQLAPLDKEATPETAFSQYQVLDINSRIQILQIICMKSVETKSIRQYMDDCSGHMTDTRKEKNDVQRNRKAAVEELRQLHEERKALQPESQSPPPPAELAELEDSKMDEPEEEEEPEDEEMADSDASAPHQGRSLRRANDRAIARKQKALADKERKAAAAAEKAKKPSKQEKQFEKVLRKIDEVKERIKEYEEDFATLENDLREADCPRTRCLGKDRFWNRYYWLERNAMPYAGLPNSSTANAAYANGCIWVQGPDDMERLGFIELNDAENTQYRRAFQMTVPERKMKEEGDTHVFSARQWGYYDDPDYLDMLIGWLDLRGVRENKLRKELQSQREKISLHMTKRQEYLLSDEREKSEAASEPATRVSTRTKTYVDTTNHRCLAWKNTTAIRELGHLHSEPKPPVYKKQRGVAQRKKAVSVEPEEEIVPIARATRGAGKAAEKSEGKRTASGRLPTRGPRYA